MGVDVVIKAVGHVTDEQLAEVNARMVEWITDGLYLEDDCEALNRDEYEPDTLEVSTWWRYYGPGHERGPWPQIYRCIRAVQAWLPQCRVYYGSDASDEVTEVTDDYLASIWAHYNGSEGDRYHAYFRELAARKERP